MAQPNYSQIHIDAPLTNISTAYLQDQKNFIASMAAPDVPVDKQSNKYFTFTKQAFQRDQMQKRDVGSESAGSGYDVSNDSYYCDVWALHKDISDFDRANTDTPLDADRSAVQFITQQALIRKEKQWADTVFTSGVWGTDSTPANLWSDYLNSDPIGDVETGKRTILVNTGQEANTLILGYDTFIKLKNHPDLVDRVKYTASANERVLSETALQTLFGVERVLVCKAVLDSAAEGLAASLGFIQGKHALLCHVARSPGLETPSAMMTFSWRGLAQGYSGMGLAMNRFRMQHLLSDRIEGHMAFTVKVTGSDLGYMWNSVVA